MADRSTAPDRDRAGVIDNPWESLRTLTTARIALGRAGVSQPTSHHLAFQLAHAQARDAVHSELDLTQLQHELSAAGHQSIALQSAASNRRAYLQRPDLGRRLDDLSAGRLAQSAAGDYDVAFIIADGLSALAVQRHAAALLESVLSRLEPDRWRVAPIVVVTQGRVAISDEIGALLGAEQAVILIGERPGLSAPDSLGVYLTYNPRIGATDAERNCVSNIHAAGLSYDAAARTLVYLLTEAQRRKLSGVRLKDASGPATIDLEERSRLG